MPAAPGALLQVYRQRMSADEVRTLIAEGALVNVHGTPDVYESTPLHEAMLLTSPLVAQVLIQAGADVNAVVKQGLDANDTRPIDVALRQPGTNAEALVKVLLAASADVSHLTKKAIPKKLQALFPQVKAGKKPTLATTKNPHHGGAGLAAWASGIDTSLDEMLHRDPTRQPSTYEPNALWDEYLLDDDIGPLVTALSEQDRDRLKQMFLEQASKLTRR